MTAETWPIGDAIDLWKAVSMAADAHLAKLIPRDEGPELLDTPVYDSDPYEAPVEIPPMETPPPVVKEPYKFSEDF